MGVYQLPAEDIPVLSNVDLVVIGGTFAGVSCALEYANLGKKVMVVESRTYLGSELTATLSPWVIASKQEKAKLLQSCINICGKPVALKDSELTVFHMDQLKLHLEESLLAAGVELLYASLPVGIASLDRERNGLIIANKSGRQLIRCQGIVDATETAITTFLSGAPLKPTYTTEKAYFKRFLEFTKVEAADRVEFEVPTELGLRSHKIRLHPGFHEKGHFYVEYQMLLNAENTLEGNQLRERAAQKQGMRLAEYLVAHVPAFSKASLCSSSYELKGPYFLDDEEQERQSHQDLKIENLALNHPNFWCLYKDFYENCNTGWLEAEQAAIYGEQLAQLIKFNPSSMQKGFVKKVEPSIENSYDVKIPDNFIEGKLELEPVQEQDIPLSKTAQVLVTGGGSSGGPAAMVSAQQGLSTILVDLNPGLGGTGTFGGVDSYWFGHRHGFAEKIMNLVKEVQETIRYKGPKWNIEAKKYALLTTADRFGVDMLFNTLTFGAITKGNRVAGSVVATRWGVCSILADCVIDATGDGDLAAFAGAAFEYGSARDHVVMWYSLAQYKSPGKLQNNFTSMVNVSDIRDYTRAILAGRRRGQPGRRNWRTGKDGCHDHGIYIAPRESRHIIGDVVMTMNDQLLQRKWPDAINIHFSNHDMKGISEANWLNMGLIPPNLEIEIPYRMLLPKGLDGILVVGKAISATHDALPAIRMQSDLENLGGIAALAAGLSIKEKKYPREISYQKLQEKLVEEGLIPNCIVSRNLAPIVYSDNQLKSLVETIEVEQPLYDYSNRPMDEIYQHPIPFVEICTVGERIIPFLVEAYHSAEGIRKVRLAQALAMYESNVGVPALISEINSMLKGDGLPKRTADILYVTLPPDHGAMPDVCYLIYSLGLAKDRRSLDVYRRVVDLFHPSEEDFKDPWWGIFYYVHAICFGAERLGDREAIPTLSQLLEIPYLTHQHCHDGYQADYFLERRSLLELAIGRALARCGSRAGYEILIHYLEDVRSLLSKQAHTELKRLSGLELNKDSDKWWKWLADNESGLVPQPYQERNERMEDSEQILRSHF